MDGVFFLMSIIGIGLAMWWVLQNDRVAPDKPTRGVFAMRLDGGKRGSRAWRAASERMPGTRRPAARPDEPDALGPAGLRRGAANPAKPGGNRPSRPL